MLFLDLKLIGACLACNNYLLQTARADPAESLLEYIYILLDIFLELRFGIGAVKKLVFLY